MFNYPKAMLHISDYNDGDTQDKAHITSILIIHLVECRSEGMESVAILQPCSRASCLHSGDELTPTTMSHDAKSASTAHNPVNQQNLLHPEIYNVTCLRREKA